MGRPVLPYGFEAYREEMTPARDGYVFGARRVGLWTVVSEVDWYQVRLDLNALGMTSDEWLELLLTGRAWVESDGGHIRLRMWPVVGERNGVLFVGLGSVRHFAGGAPVEERLGGAA